MELTAELVARIVVLGCALSLLAFGLGVLVKERLSHRPAPVERDTSPLAAVNYVGILGFVAVGFVSAVTMIGTVPAPPDPIHVVAVVVGLVPLGLAGLLSLWGYRSLGREFSSEAEVRPDTVLITHGAFGVVRHPMYLSILLLWSGSALVLWSPLMAVCCIVLIPAFASRSRAEERILTNHFGSAYTEYAARVPMLVPGLPTRSR